MTFPGFDSHLPTDIRQKGKDYWLDGQVDNLAQDGNTWAADVYGTDEYEVELTIRRGKVENWHCDCPYDWGPICKHVAAVLFAVRQEAGEGSAKAAQSDRTAAKKKPGGPLSEIIAKLSEAELRHLLAYFAEREDSVRSHLLTKYAHLAEATSRESYRDLVASIISSHEGRDGFLDYRSASQLGDELYRLVENADKSSTHATTYLCEEVIGQVGKAVQGADDSSGSLGSALSAAIIALKELAQGGAEQEVKDYIFDLLLRTCESGEHDGYGFDDQLRWAAAAAVDAPAKAERMLQFLEGFLRKKEKEKYGRYEAESAAKLKLELLKKWRPPAEAGAFRSANMQHPSFRKSALEQAFSEKNWAELRRLAEAGIELDTANQLPGLVHQWEDWLIRLAEATGDTETVVAKTEQRFLERGDMEQYHKLKSILPKKVFEKKVEKYLRFFQKKYKGYKSHFNQQAANILQAENRWDKIMDMVAASPSLRLLDHYHAHLAKGREKKYAQFYGKCVRYQMEMSSNRNGYSECCRYLKKIAALGFPGQAKEIAEDWKAAYPRRRAMLEELKKTGF